VAVCTAVHSCSCNSDTLVLHVFEMCFFQVHIPENFSVFSKVWCCWCWWPDPRFECLGYILLNISNTCLVHDTFYIFYTDKDNMYVETYSVTEGIFRVLW